MELTPRCLRRVSSDAPSSLKNEASRLVRTNRKRAHEDLKVLPEKLHQASSKEHPATGMTADASFSPSVQVDGTPATWGTTSAVSIAMASAGTGVPQMCTSTTPTQAPSAASTDKEGDMARLLLLQDMGDGGDPKFELGGEIYCIRDTVAFKDVVVDGARRAKQPRKTLSDLRRAQRLARAAAGVGTDSEKPAVGVITEGTIPKATAPRDRARDVVLLQAWRLAKEEPLLEAMDLED